MDSYPVSTQSDAGSIERLAALVSDQILKFRHKRPWPQRYRRSAGLVDQQGTKIEKAITIGKPVEEIYTFWRNLENLPRFMTHLKAVKIIDSKRSLWTAQTLAGHSIQWDAVIIEDRPNEMVSWKTLDDSDLPNAGSVWFKNAPGSRGTEIRISIKLDPPGGQWGMVFAKLFGEDPANVIHKDLERFKQLVETGEVATTMGQPTGRASDKTA